MKTLQPMELRLDWRWAAVVTLATIVAGSVAGCASQVDLSSIRREQRMLARRLADQKADLDRLSSEVSRLRNSMHDTRYGGTPSGSGQSMTEPYGRGGYPPETAGHPGQPVGPGTAAGGRDYATGNDYGGAGMGSGTSGQSTSGPGGFAAATPPPAADRGTSKLESDMARGSDSEYQAGLQSYARGDYQRAVQSLRNYVSRNPRDSLVPVAQYWIGEAYFAQGKYNESILAFNEILVSWPESDRKPAALLRQADAFARTGDKIDARMILQKLMEDHPGSPEAAEAREELRVLGG